MSQHKLHDDLNAFVTTPWCTVEEQHMIRHFTDFLNSNPDSFSRANKGHVTSSIWIVNAQKTHALLTHHKKFNLWVQLGGHNDGQTECKMVAAQEAVEESGIGGLTFLHGGIFDIDIHPIPGPCEYHYDVRYLMQAPAGAQYNVSDESHDLAWVPFDKMSDYTSQSSVLRMNEKFKKFFIFDSIY
jgi:8-oxo-dGTP pyrophosphatase MutT (NUDIX family)